ncbi:hypothetical protein D9757_005232 [Collybiopsis confluens]|uniref:Uncharacterized protein n=1 Tax=Collybiopsis confluens TaxID=2823264 RepID=A0A8H5HVU7_9AGAR|nr:hypothetical protein D9757_005232 [Collybiopsis confluens]
MKFGLQEDLDPPQNSSILREALPELKNLSCVDLTNADNLSVQLLDAFSNHSSVSTVLVRTFSALPANDLPSLDLSKISIARGDYSFFIEHPLPSPRGSQFQNVFFLKVTDGDLGRDNFANQVYRGLHSLLYCNKLSPMTWLPTFTANHPNLNEIRFHYDVKSDPDHYRIPFFESFVENVRQMQVASHKFGLEQFVFNRTSPSSSFPNTPPFQDWHLSHLHVDIWESSTQVLSLFAASFPNLGSLFVGFAHILPEDQVDLKYGLDDLVNVLARFRSLRSFGSMNLFLYMQLPVQFTSPMQDPSSKLNINPYPPSDMLAAFWNKVAWKMYRYTPHIASAVVSLNHIRIWEEMGGDPDSEVEDPPTLRWDLMIRRNNGAVSMNVVD